VLGIVLGIVLSSAVACGVATVPVAATAPTPVPPPPPIAPTICWPLTGLESGSVAPHPAVAVKIENSTSSRPQTGLNAADVVWEEVVEGGITRFVAVYHSTLPPDIGPVRSVRPMDPAIVAPLGGLLAFSGGQGPFVDAVVEAGLQVVSHDAGSPGFYRLSTRSAPHDVYARPAELLAQADADHQRPPEAQFRFTVADEQPTAWTAGAPTSVLDLQLSGAGTPTLTWSPAGRAWLRSEGSTPAVGADGVPLRAANVIVLRVQVVNTDFSDPAGNPVPETRMIGSGEALVATGGRSVLATWTKASLTAPLDLTAPDGRPVLLTPGNTWVELVPTGSGSVTRG
jgi:hypothetical protein